MVEKKEGRKKRQTERERGGVNEKVNECCGRRRWEKNDR